MWAIVFKGEKIATFNNAIIASIIAINRFATGQLLRNEVEVIYVG